MTVPARSPTADYDPRLERCPLCNDGVLHPFDGDYRGHTFDCCGGCGIKMMNPQYSDHYLAQFYGGYISVDDQGGDTFRSRRDVRRMAKERSLRLLSSCVTARDDATRRRILMVGCGDGLELEIAGEHDWQVEGYDVDPATTAEVAARYGVPVHSGPFEELPLADGRFDAVFMDQVIEHLKRPAPYLETLHRLLRPGGTLFLGMPNIGSIANRLKTLTSRYHLRKRRRGSHYASKHHIFYYTPGVLRRVLDMYGFRTVLVRSSLKVNPKRPWTAWVGKWFPSVDSGFIALAERR